MKRILIVAICSLCGCAETVQTSPDAIRIDTLNADSVDLHINYDVPIFGNTDSNRKQDSEIISQITKQ